MQVGQLVSNILIRFGTCIDKDHKGMSHSTCLAKIIF